MRIKITTKATGEIKAKLSNENPKTVKAIWDSLPIETRTNTWGEEIYFNIPVEIKLENEKETVEMGDIAYWPPGTAFCIFFGKTPVSKGDEIRPASAVNVIGKICADPKIFKKVKSGDNILIEKA
jgi:hypothetical protein